MPLFSVMAEAGWLGVLPLSISTAEKFPVTAALRSMPEPTAPLLAEANDTAV